MHHIFYKVTYSVDGRYYYGSHSGNLDDNYRGSNKIISLIRKKHGIQYLIRENLKFFNSRKECLAFEDRFLKLYNLKDDQNSMNLKNSAQGGDTWSHMSEDDKNKRKLNLSNKIKGSKNGNYGKPMPIDRKNKMIETKTGVPIHTEEYKSKLGTRIKSEFESGVRDKNFISQYSDNRKGKSNGDDWNNSISKSLLISQKNKDGAILRSKNTINKNNLKLLNVKTDIINGLTDDELLLKYNIKPITLYTWKIKIKTRNL